MPSSSAGARLVLAVLAGFGLAAPATAAPTFNPAAAVQHRQQVMKGHAADMKAIEHWLKGETSYSVAEQKASALALSIRDELPRLFPKGTSTADVAKSHAKPIIWSDPKRFDAALHRAAQYADALAAAVKSGNKQQAAMAFGTMGRDGCGGCHRVFATRTTH